MRLRIDDDLRRSRLTVFFRLFLAFPHFLWLSIWSMAAVWLVLFNWFATLFTGRTEDDVHSFIARTLRYSTHINAYVYLVANPWPPFSGKPGTYPVDLEIDLPAPQNRWVTAFRLILAIPAYVFAEVLRVVAQLLAVAGWFIALILGRIPVGMRDLIAFCLRYQAQMYAYVLLLTDRYPGLGSGGGSQ